MLYQKVEILRQQIFDPMLCMKGVLVFAVKVKLPWSWDHGFQAFDGQQVSVEGKKSRLANHRARLAPQAYLNISGETCDRREGTDKASGTEPTQQYANHRGILGLRDFDHPGSGSSTSEN